MENESISDSAGRMLDEGRDKLNEYADKGMEYVWSVNSLMTGFIRDEPLLAMATVFAAGYLAARMLNQLTRR